MSRTKQSKTFSCKSMRKYKVKDPDLAIFKYILTNNWLTNLLPKIIHYHLSKDDSAILYSIITINLLLIVIHK